MHGCYAAHPKCMFAAAGVQSFTVHAYDFAVSDVPLTPTQYAAVMRHVSASAVMLPLSAL